MSEDEIEIVPPKKRKPRAQKSQTQKLQEEISQLVKEGRPVPNDLRMNLSFAVVETIEDPDKKLRGLLAITKTFKSADTGMDDAELLAKTPKSVLQAIARAKNNNMNRFLKAME